MSRFTTSAPSRSAASSNETRVRVLRLEEQVGDGVSGQALVAGRQIARLAHVELRQIEQLGQLSGGSVLPA